MFDEYAIGLIETGCGEHGTVDNRDDGFRKRDATNQSLSGRRF